MFTGFACDDVIEFFLRKLTSTVMNDSGFVIDLNMETG